MVQRSHPPIAKGGTAPESLDVVVNIGPFPNNNAPSLDISSSATAVPAGTPVAFTATASDPEGDSLAYFWDFGDKTYGLNGASLSKSWNTVGEYVVNCVVSDMKGGTASRWMVITVGSPSDAMPYIGHKTYLRGSGRLRLISR
jgi:PKD repeat protein